MRGRWSNCAPIALLLLLAAAVRSVAGLADEIEFQISRSDLGDATIAVSVRDGESGAPLAAINDQELLIPASNMKLFTTGAALHVLGPEFEFRTRVLRRGGDLIVVGDGDPGFGDPAVLEIMAWGDRVGVDVETFLDLWVSAVTEDVDRILVDDRVFDRQFIHEDWPADQLNRRYCAEVAGLNFHANVIDFYPRPGPGRPNLDLFRPRASWLAITNRATVRDGTRDRNDVWIARRPDDNALTFYGNVKYAYRSPVAVTVHDVPAFFAELLADRLRAAGISVGVAETVAPDAPAPTGVLVGPVFATPLVTVVTRCNRDSQNLYAESLLKRIGNAVSNEPGSWTNGTAVVRQVVYERLDDPSLAMKLAIRDGSGLGRGNRVAAATVTAWLDSLQADPRIADAFVGSLARAGASGTLEKRFRGVDLHGTTVQAKSGYIRQVSCLSGYVTAPDRKRRSFSILVNGLREPGSVGRAKDLQERILSVIAWDLTAAATVMGGE